MKDNLMDFGIVHTKSSNRRAFQDYIEDLEFQLLEFSYIELYTLEDMIQEKSGFLVMRKDREKPIYF